MSRDSEKIAMLISEYKDTISLIKSVRILDRIPESFSVVEAFERIKNKKIKQLNECYKTLYRNCDEDVLQILIELLNDEDLEIQFRATIAFRVLNKKAKNAIPHLQKALQRRENKEIRFELLYTLLAIEGLEGEAMKELECMRDHDELDINQQWKFETLVVREEKRQ